MDWNQPQVKRRSKRLGSHVGRPSWYQPRCSNEALLQGERVARDTGADWRNDRLGLQHDRRVVIMAKAFAALHEVLLTIAAVAGGIAIVLAVLGFTFNLSLVMFQSGSMAPTIPSGSVALVTEIPAGSAEVGDIVTVDRPGQLSVTHRVAAIEPAESGLYLLTLRGDANAADDPLRYKVSEVGKVMGSLPGLAPAIAWLSHPLTLATLTLMTAALVVWAFWPSRLQIEGARS